MDYRKYQPEYLFTGAEILTGGKVLITDSKGKVLSVSEEAEAGGDIQKLRGILSPGFINCHCHLELSHMKGMISKHLGMTSFLRWVVQNRGFKNELIQEGLFTTSIVEKLEGKNVEWKPRWLVFIFLEWYKRWMKAGSNAIYNPVLKKAV